MVSVAEETGGRAGRLAVRDEVACSMTGRVAVGGIIRDRDLDLEMNPVQLPNSITAGGKKGHTLTHTGASLMTAGTSE